MSLAYTVGSLGRLPRVQYLRWRERHQPLPARKMLEQFSYRRSLYDFLRASAHRPDLLTDFDIDESSVVLDVGAYLGQWSKRVLTRSDCRVFAFEPNPVVAERLHECLDPYPSATIVEYGLSDRDTVAELGLAGPGSTVFARSHPHGMRSIELRDVVTALDQLGLDHADVMKVNIEGGEYDLLERIIQAGWHRRIGTILVQFHEWIPAAHRRRRAIRRALASTHRLVWDYPWVWEKWQRDA